MLEDCLDFLSASLRKPKRPPCHLPGTNRTLLMGFVHTHSDDTFWNKCQVNGNSSLASVVSGAEAF